MSEAIYTFNGKDITLNVCIQIRAVVDELQKRLNVSFEDAMLMFYRSETYKTLQKMLFGQNRLSILQIDILKKWILTIKKITNIILY